MRPTTLRAWLLSTLLWSIYILTWSTDLVDQRGGRGEPIGYFDALLANLASFWIFIPLSVALISCVERFPLERGRWWRSALVLNLLVAAVVLIRAGYIWVTDVWHVWLGRSPSFGSVLRETLPNNVIVCWLIIGVGHALHFFERARERERQMAALQSSLLDARLAALSAQLQPHFLFNTLNSIAELIHHDADAADRMLVSLSTLLRRSLSRHSEHEVPLAEELELVRHYLQIEKVRLGSRLEVRQAIAPDCPEATVPVLMLQTLVENAIVHSIARRRTPGRISIEAHRQADQLVVEVENDGPQDEEPRDGHGIGLANAQERLRCLYGAHAELTLAVTDRQTVRARLAVPYRLAPRAERAALFSSRKIAQRGSS